MESDWDHKTIIRKKPVNAKASSNASVLNEARRKGGVIETSKKYGGGGNKTASGIDSAKLDRDMEETKHKTVSVSVSKAIMQGRQAMGLSQKDLATKCNEKPSIISEYEQGKAIPNQQVLGKMERALGIKLRGQNIGSKLEPRGKKNKK